MKKKPGEFLEIIEVGLPKIIAKRATKNNHAPDPLDYLIATARYFRVSIDEIKNTKKTKGIVRDAVRYYAYIASRKTNYGVIEIGKLINKDHSTITYHGNVMAGWLEENSPYKKEIELNIYRIQRLVNDQV